LKRAIVSLVLLAAIMVLASCGGGGSSSSNTNQGSKVKTRAFVSNSFAGVLDIIDYSKDQQTAFTVSAGNSPQFMVVSNDKAFTMVFDGSSANTVSIVDNKTEKSGGSISLPDATEGMAISPDSKTAYVSIRNAQVTGQQSGAVWLVDLTTQAAGSILGVPLVRHITLNHAGTFLLAVSESPVLGAAPAQGAPQGQITIIDTAKKTIVGTINADLDPAYFTTVDRPIQAIFSSDDSKAYIVNCGPECGGTTASVGVLDMTTGHMVASSTVPLTAGTTALLDGTNLYVAGTAAGIGGVLTPLTVNGSTLTKGNTVAIGDGFHTVMGKGSNNKVFIGANPCSNSGNAGCLSIFDTSTGKVVVDQAKGFVTGMDAVPTRDVMYVVEGTELRVYDTTTSAEKAGILIDIFGAVYDVKVIDK
jgi:PBP1b-binding outer membrane lipoprotein LpoB